MPLIKKIKTASNILKNRGLKGLFAVVVAKLNCSFQPDEAQMVFQVLKDKDHPGLMIDVGAHHGSSLTPFAEHGWQVIAFEPDSNNRAVLTNTFEGYENVIIDPRACSDQPQPAVTLYTSDESSGVSGLSAFLESHQASEQVAATTLWIALQEHKISTKPVDFLKIDTEGFDLMVLKGYPWSHATHPSVILCEFEDSKTSPLGYDFHQLAAYLVDLDYQLIISEWYPIKAYGRVHRWRRFAAYPCQLTDPQGWGNIFAVKGRDQFKQLSHLCRLD